MRISDWSSDVCSSDLPTAMLRLGQLYFSFQDARAQNAAVGWLRRASQLGQSYAMVELGRAYASGAGVEIDPVKAVYYFRSAAVAGNADGMIEYGRSSAPRSEERREGKECVSTVRSRWLPEH